MHRVRLVVLVSAAAALGLSACGDDYSEPESQPRVVEIAGARAERCAAGSYHVLETKQRAYAAVVRRSAAARARPGGRVVARFGRLNVNGVPTVFSVRGAVVGADCKARWYRAQVPVKPNGAEAWVRAADVDVTPIATRIEVDLSERRVTLFRSGRAVMSAPAAVGSPATPTPTGRFYVNQRLIPNDPSGPFGPGAIGVSAFSDVLTGWAQGGPIAIHGTNRPDSIGRAVSNGCIRVPNAQLRRLFAAAWAGTPVVIHA